ncbi:hypothetical protein GPJ59_33750 [Streptomyces bambusae]|uniref:Uncharacterized protein n=1 Tax=Streptomyces bambusae TaxID=1550616 RepID=A0ABS6ZFY8_9ACTN|nr:hypothetical protein [Streptomyces bambusae]
MGPTVLPLPAGDWTPLPGATLREAGCEARHRGEVPVAELLRHGPVTVLLRVDDGSGRK